MVTLMKVELSRAPSPLIMVEVAVGWESLVAFALVVVVAGTDLDLSSLPVDLAASVALPEESAVPVALLSLVADSETAVNWLEALSSRL